MFSKSKMLILAALTLMAVTAFASTSSAASFRIAPGGAISSPSVGLLTFGEGSTTVQCEITLRGTLSTALLNKVAGTQFGTVTGVSIAEARCRGGSIEPAGILIRTPWPLKYQSILGTLPEAVTGILFTVERASFNLEIFSGFVNCLYSGNPGALLTVAGRNPYTTGGIAALPTRLPLIRGGFGCPASGTMNGRFTITAQTITRL